MARYYKPSIWENFINRLFQIVVMIFAIIFILITLGFISVEIEWDDGTKFKYKGWQMSKEK